MTNIVNLVNRAIDEMIMPPETVQQVLVDGRAIPNLTAKRGNGTVHFMLDRRFGVEVPDDCAVPVAYFVAQAMAIGAGYPSANAESKDRAFAPQVMRLSDLPE